MNSGKINNFTPKTLAENYSDIKFNIPIYQRLFAWKTEQIHKLLDDLKDSFKKDEQNYYLGILTLSRNIDTLDVIDGQQRLTVVSLLAIAFKELCRYDLNYWDKFLNHGNRVEFSARENDTLYFKSRVCEIDPPHINEMMHNSIIVIKEWLRSQFKDQNDIVDNKAIINFSDFIWNRLTFFCSYLPYSYINNPRELNKYFEAMNSTGRQLQQHEILLVKLIKNHPKSESLSKLWTKIGDVNKRFNSQGEDESKESYRDRYKSLIRDYKTLFTDNNSSIDFPTIMEIEPKVEKISESNAEERFKMIISFEELLLLALDITLDRESNSSFYKTDHLLTRFQEAQLNDGMIDSFFENLVKCRLFYDYKIIWQETDGDYDYNLLSLDHNQNIEKFQSMLHVSYPTQYYRWQKQYIKWLIENPDSTPEFEFDKLLEIDRSLHPILPPLEDLTYSSIGSGKVERYWFWRLDFELWKNLDSDWLKEYPEYRESVKRYVFRTNRSIEHLHPQTPTDSHSEKWQGYELNRFGNLAMISSSFNSMQSNLPAGMKMERIHHQIETSQLQSLKMLDMWIKFKASNDKNPPDTWTKDKVDWHEAAMYRYLENIYK